MSSQPIWGCRRPPEHQRPAAGTGIFQLPGRSVAACSQRKRLVSVSRVKLPRNSLLGGAAATDGQTYVGYHKLLNEKNGALFALYVRASVRPLQSNEPTSRPSTSFVPAVYCCKWHSCLPSSLWLTWCRTSQESSPCSPVQPPRCRCRFRRRRSKRPRRRLLGGGYTSRGATAEACCTYHVVSQRPGKAQGSPLCSPRF